jgi:hypothetical protein
MLSGCKIEFQANTMVLPDGGVTRTTRHISSGAEDKELKTRYQLFSGGTWTKGKSTRYDSFAKKDVEAITDVYEVTKHYASGESIPSDFVRRAEVSDRSARNQIRMTVQDYGFLKTFDYEERFQDIITMEEFEAAARKLYAGWIEHFAGTLTQESEGRMSAVLAREKLDVKFGPLLDFFLTGFRSEGKGFAESQTFKDKLEPRIQEARIIAEVMEVFPPPLGEQTDAWREAVNRAFRKTNDMMEKRWDNTPLQDELFGVHGLGLFQDYGFTMILSLPGTVVESNVTMREGEVLKWEFKDSDFFLKDYVIHARSRLIYLERIVLIAGMLFVLIAVFGMLAWRNRKRRL